MEEFIKKIQKDIQKETNSNKLNQGINFSFIYFKELNNFLIRNFRKKFSIDINNVSGTPRYDSAYTMYNDEESYTIFIGFGLIKNIASGLLDHDKEMIDNLIRTFTIKYNSTDKYILAINIIFVSSLSTFINHEILHCILGIKKENKNILEDEICADFCSGHLMETLYDIIKNNLKDMHKDIYTREAVSATLITCGIFYSIWKLHSIYYVTTVSQDHPDIKVRPILVSSALFESLEKKYNFPLEKLISNLYKIPQKSSALYK